MSTVPAILLPLIRYLLSLGLDHLVDLDALKEKARDFLKDEIKSPFWERVALSTLDIFWAVVVEEVTKELGKLGTKQLASMNATDSYECTHRLACNVWSRLDEPGKRELLMA